MRRRSFMAAIAAAAFGLHTRLARRVSGVRKEGTTLAWRAGYSEIRIPTSVLQFDTFEAAVGALGEPDALKLLNRAYQIEQLAHQRKKLVLAYQYGARG